MAVLQSCELSHLAFVISLSPEGADRSLIPPVVFHGDVLCPFEQHLNSSFSAYFTVCGKSHCKRPVSTKETEESCKNQLHLNKGREFTRLYPYGICLGVLEDMVSFYPKLLSACCPPAFPIGWGTRKIQPSWITYTIFPCKMYLPHPHHALHGH